MKSVLISIQRPHTDNIKALIKKIEIRENKPNQETPFTCFIYETKTKGGCGKVIGEFVCDEIITISYTESNYLRRTFTTDKPVKIKETCLTPSELDRYAFNNKGIFELPTLYGWHITKLKIYDKPKELNEFRKLFTPKKLDIRKFIIKNGINNIAPEFKSRYDFCDKITRPPQSWCYVESLGE